MKKHTRIYLISFNYNTSDFIPCEVCRRQAVDIHHIHARGMGGSKLRDYIENLQALCRECHNKYGDKNQFLLFLKKAHEQAMLSSNIIFDEKLLWNTP